MPNLSICDFPVALVEGIKFVSTTQWAPSKRVCTICNIQKTYHNVHLILSFISIKSDIAIRKI